jgi:hypothetical protein
LARRRSKPEKRLEEGGKSSSRSGISLLLAFAAGCIVCSGLFFLLGSGKSPQVQSGPLNVDQLLRLSDEELAKVDIGLVNLLCAEGLDGSEDLDIQQCLATLDEWAEIVRKDTKARMPSFFNNPAKYDNSINLFKIVTMILCLKQDIGVDYNVDIMKREVFPDSKDVFIHGCLTGKKQGGCVSIPTLCVAVGRRLGYPLKLVCTREHVFFRWDDGKDVFNMEACCTGCDSHPDEYYKSWPKKISEDEIRANKLLKSLTPSEELALFLETRGHCLFDTGRAAEAQIMYAYAYNLMPTHVKLGFFDRVTRTELKKIMEQ